MSRGTDNRQAGWDWRYPKICPVYAHKDPDSAYSVTIPDFPGCFSAADELEALPRMIPEAVEGHF